MVLLMRLAIALGLLVPCGFGCARWSREARRAESPLRPAVASDDSVTLEIFFARYPPDDPSFSSELWESIDEQRLPGSVRRALNRNGFRAGVVGGQLPDQLAELLCLTDTAPTAPEMVSRAGLEGEPAVHRRLLQLRFGKRGEILASSLYDRLPVLMRKNGQVSGRTFTAAQGLFGITAEPQDDGRIGVRLMPEVHYGDARPQWSGREGIWQMQVERPRETLEQLELETALAPGQMLIVTSLPNRPGSLGHYFFSDRSSRGEEQKLLLIRLTKTPPAELYLPPEFSGNY